MSAEMWCGKYDITLDILGTLKQETMPVTGIRGQ